YNFGLLLRLYGKNLSQFDNDFRYFYRNKKAICQYLSDFLKIHEQTIPPTLSQENLSKCKAIIKITDPPITQPLSVSSGSSSIGINKPVFYHASNFQDEIRLRPWFPKENYEYGDLAKMLSPTCYKILFDAVSTLTHQYPDFITSDSVMLFPAIEGVGYYPKVNNNLQMLSNGHALNIWCAGDLVGKFRGLVPALISGYYVARQVTYNLLIEETQKTLNAELYLAKSICKIGFFGNYARLLLPQNIDIEPQHHASSLIKTY
ncbi:MAG: hypothetical protein WCW01_07160, partial [Gammaproteobacteria bacterium]